MKTPFLASIALSGLAVLTVGLVALAAQGGGRGGNAPVTIRAARVFDGKGNVIENGVVTVQGSKITAVGKLDGPVTYDLGDATLLPGMIDVHVHLNWYFSANGKYNGGGDTAEYQQQAVLDNAKRTLMAGFTTVQSLGAASDKPLRDAIAAGIVPGPRLLTSISQIQGGTLTPDQLRDRVRQAKAQGADVIKFFASGSIRDGGKMNVTQAQVDPVCGEAKAQGLRSLVHAHDPASILASVKAGCSQIEHGLFADDASIKAMKDANVFFDPNIGLVLQNYLWNKDHYLGSGNFNDEGFAAMEKALPNLPVIFKKALDAGLRMPMGTDAVAGAHGENAREIIARVKAGQSTTDALIGATSLAAESLGLGTTIGTLAPGFEADIVAVPGNAVADISNVHHTKFVMKGGRVYKRQ
jgi:imidazolonepropionase-like amidohydrolase